MAAQIIVTKKFRQNVLETYQYILNTKILIDILKQGTVSFSN